MLSFSAARRLNDIFVFSGVGRFNLALIFIFLLAVVILDLVTLKGVSLIFSNPNFLSGNLPIYIFSMLSLILTKSAISICTYYVLTKISHQLLGWVRIKLIKNFFSGTRTSHGESGWLLELIQRHSGIFCVHYVQSILRLLVDASIILSITIYVALQNLSLVLPTLIIIIVPLYVWNFLTRQKLKFLAQHSNSANLTITSITNNLLNGQDEVRVNGLPDRIVSSFSSSSEQVTRAQSFTQALMNGPKHLWELCFFILAGWFLVMENFNDPDAQDLAGIAVGLAALLRVAPLLNSLTVALNNIRHSGPSVSFVTQSLERDNATQIDREGLPNQTEGALANICFATGGLFIVSGSINTRRENKKDTGLVLIKGPSGAGKTTLARAIVGIEDARLIDPKLIELNSQAETSKGVRWSSQVPVIIDDCMANNINLYDEIPDLPCALERLRLCDDESYSGFLDLNVVSGENTISTGQARRLGILRALYGDGDFIVLDEPESGLDPESKESVVQLVIETSRAKKVIVISHTDHFDDACDIFIRVK